LNFFLQKSEKNILFFAHFHSKILLKDYDFWQFSTHPGYVRVCGKLPNRSKIAPGGLWKCAIIFLIFSEN
jgi:hypothetical protein